MFSLQLMTILTAALAASPLVSASLPNFCKAPCIKTLQHQVSGLQKEVHKIEQTLKHLGPGTPLPPYVATIDALNTAITNEIFTPTNIAHIRQEVLGTTTCAPVARKRDFEHSEMRLESRAMEGEERMESERMGKRQGGGDSFLGELVLVAFQFCPVGFSTAAGQSLSIAQNTALFALLGTTYGGDGISTFNLPDLREQSLKCAIWCIALQGIFPSRP